MLDASVDQEACPLNLAPTTSTTVALALGDALAMTLMRAKGLTEDDFASNHPAGQLGKRLTLRVADLMHSGVENPTIGSDASWMDIVSTISQYGLGAVNVLTKSGRLLESLRRLIAPLSAASGPRDSPCKPQMHVLMTNPVVASPEMLVFEPAPDGRSAIANQRAAGG